MDFDHIQLSKKEEDWDTGFLSILNENASSEPTISDIRELLTPKGLFIVAFQ